MLPPPSPPPPSALDNGDTIDRVYLGKSERSEMISYHSAYEAGGIMRSRRRLPDEHVRPTLTSVNE